MAVSYYHTRMIAIYVSSQIVFCLVCWPCAPIPLCMDSLKVLPQYHQYCLFHLQYHHNHHPHGFPTNYHQSYSHPPGRDDISYLIMIKYGNVTVSLMMMMWICKTESKSSTCLWLSHVFKGTPMWHNHIIGQKNDEHVKKNDKPWVHDDRIWKPRTWRIDVQVATASLEGRLL